jgi:hypothetical protein
VAVLFGFALVATKQLIIMNEIKMKKKNPPTYLKQMKEELQEASKMAP